MPVQRAEALECFKYEKTLTAKQLSELTKKSVRTCQRLLKELQFLDIIESSDSDGTTAKEYSIKKQYISFFQTTPSNFLSRLKEELENNPREKIAVY